MTTFQLQTKCRGVWVTMQQFSNFDEATRAYKLAIAADADCDWSLVISLQILHHTAIRA